MNFVLHPYDVIFKVRLLSWRLAESNKLGRLEAVNNELLLPSCQCEKGYYANVFV